MARAIEKGATHLDKLCHKLYDEPKGRGFRVDGKCSRCGGPLMTYYCEDRLHLIVCEKCGTLALTKAVAPQVAANLMLGQPTLTPPNEPLTLDKKRAIAESCLHYSKSGCCLLRGYAPLDCPRCKEWQSNEANVALTLEQLREMNGEPVYIIASDMGIAEWNVIAGKEWITVAYDVPRNGFKAVVEGVGLINGRAFRIDSYGTDWFAYRRPAEGEEDNNGT